MFKIKNKVNLKNYEVNFEHFCETASEVISKKEFYLQFSYVFFIKKCFRYTKIIVITMEEHDKGGA